MTQNSLPEGGNITPFPNHAAVKEEAGMWLVRLDGGSLTETDLDALREWIQRSDFHREYLFKLARNWDAMGILEELGQMFPLPEQETEQQEISLAARLLERLLGHWQLPSRATLALAAVPLVMLLTFAMFTLGGKDYVTGVGEHATYTLDDGTVVHLNTNTKLTVDYSDSRRAITLVHGEASFDVAKNPERPFVVYAHDGLVWAVGTAFNVRDRGDTVDVLVTEGRVKVFSNTLGSQQPALKMSADVLYGQPLPDAKIKSNSIAATADAIKPVEALIGAGQALSYSYVIEAQEDVSEEEFTRKLAWQEGALVFKGETLKEALVEIGRYTNKKLVLADASLASLRIGGHYKTDDIDALLSSLGQGLGLFVEYASNDRVILSADRS